MSLLAAVEMHLVRLKSEHHSVWESGPQPVAAIAELEGALGHRLPPSYREFLERFGGLAVGDSAVSGILENSPLRDEAGSTYGDTLLFRSEYGLPGHLLVIEPDFDAPYCLDLAHPRADGECPVVCFELHSQASTPVADSFAAWLADNFLARWK